MRRFLAAMATVLTAMAMTATKWVKRAGTWVLEQVTPASPPMPQLPPELSPSAHDADDFTALRRVAGILAMDRDPEPGDMRGLADDHLAWLRVLDRRGLCRVLAADDKTLRGHIRGTTPMRAMPRAERDAVAALLRARERYDYEGEVEEERSLAWAPAL
jgi:hypothetical protein